MCSGLNIQLPLSPTRLLLAKDSEAEKEGDDMEKMPKKRGAGRRKRKRGVRGRGLLCSIYFWGSYKSRLRGFLPYLLSPSLPSNVKIKRIKAPGPDNKRSKIHQPDFEESCKRRTRIVKFGMI